ncbi:MAG TPA: hypothetical protein VF006_02925 [Longimicrobium sp.]
MTRFLVRSLLLAVAVSAASMQGASAQEGPVPRARIIVAPQVGAVVDHSRGAELNVLASLVAEMPIGSGWSVAAEWTRPYGGYIERLCMASEAECETGAELRSSGALGVMVRPVRLGPLEPYAGVAGGAVRWARESRSGVARMASARAGLDVHVLGAFGLRADLVRRWAWTETPGATPLHTDMISLGARFSFGR